MEELARFFPKEEQPFWQKALKGRLTELRMRAGKPLLLSDGQREWFVSGEGERICHAKGAKVMERQDLSRLLLHFCKHSLYAYEEELREGYLTLEGGHRLGVAGQVVTEAGKIRTIKNISFLNLRIARQLKGIAEEVLPRLYEQGRIQNTLIVSPPGCGKTTLLRELIRLVSDGNPYGEGVTVGVVDERSELAGCFLGVPQNDLGIRTDVLDGCPKAIGMRLMIRSMAPVVIAVDELGRPEDLEELAEASRCGVRLLATAHGASAEDVRLRGLEEFFDCILLLGKREGRPVILRCLERKKEVQGGSMGGKRELDRRMHDTAWKHGTGRILLPGGAKADQDLERTEGALRAHGRGDPIWQENPSGMSDPGRRTEGDGAWKVL